MLDARFLQVVGLTSSLNRNGLSAFPIEIVRALRRPNCSEDRALHSSARRGVLN